MAINELPLEAPNLPVEEGAKSHDKLHYWSWWMLLFVAVWLVVYLVFFPEPLALFQRNWPLIFVGVFGAMIGNATAVGGGLVFVPYMMFVYHLDPVSALKLAIASQSVGMTSGAIGWLRRKTVSRDGLIVAVPPLILGSVVSSLIIRPNALLVKGLFGPASIFIGLVMLLILNRHNGKEFIPRTAYLLLAGMAFVGGVITGWVAIGVGEVIAAFLMLIYSLKPERSIGLGVVLLAVNSVFLLAIHGVFLGGIPWELAIFTMLGTGFGGRLGPYVSQWIGQRRLKLGFALIAIVDGLIFVLQFLKSSH